MAEALGKTEGGGARALRLGLGFVLFQSAWFACVMGAARGQAALGVAAVAAAVTILIAWSPRRVPELWLLLIAVTIGFVWDGLLAFTGVVQYAAPGPLSGWAPAWILAMWALLAPMLREPMRWLHGRPLLAAALGGVGGALSYAAAARLGACRFPDFTLAMVVLGIGWAVILPLLLAAAQRLDRVGAAGRPVAVGEARA